MHSDSEEDFITSTIRDVDAYLAGERASEERELSNDAEYAAWSAEISEQNEREQEQWWAEHCPVHNDELHDGVCLLCAQEERVNDL